MITQERSCIEIRKLKWSLANRPNQRANLFVNPSDHVGFEVLVDGCCDPFLTDHLQTVSAKYRSSLFIDIGANIGLISIQVSDYFGQKIALEPKPIDNGVLQENTLTHISESKLILKNYGLESKSKRAISII